MEDFRIRDGVLEAYTGREEFLDVPDGIHTIGEGAFKGCVSVKRIVLPGGLRRIEEGAFKGCRRLEEVEIPQGVTGLGAYAFHRCHELKRVVLPGSAEELGACAFLYCDSLKEIRMPGVKRLGNQAFLNDMQLEQLQISRELDGDCICEVFTGCGRVREISFADGERWIMANVVEAAEQKELPPLVRRIVLDILKTMDLDGRCMNRYLLNIKHVEVPEGIERLGRSCFFDMRGILSVKLPASLKEIGSRAFRNCIGLERVSFENTDVAIHEDAFRNCTALKKIRVPGGTEYTLAGLKGLSDGEADTGKELDSGKEEGSGKEEVPELVRRIQRQLLGNFRISGTLLLKYLGEESRVVVPEGITRIAEEAFAGNEAINRVILPDSVQEIGEEVFRDCLLLQTIVLPDGLRRLGAGAFENCVKLLRIQLPPGIADIEDRTFRRCRALQEIELPAGLRTIGESSFYGCRSLKKAELPDSLTHVGKMAFYRCSSLKEIRLPAGTQTVGSLAFAESGLKKAAMSACGGHCGTDIFAGCEKLKTLVLEEGVRHIPDKLAFGCAALERVSLPGTLESAGRHPWEGTAFLRDWLERYAGEDYFQAEAVAEGAPETGKHSEYQNEPAEDFPEPLSRAEENSEKASANGIFWDGRNCSGTVRISGQVRIIAGGAFYGNAGVTEIYLPESVSFIGPAAFKGCSNLRKVIWPSGVRNLQAETFSGCARLEEVRLAGTGKKTPAAGLPSAQLPGKETPAAGISSAAPLVRSALPSWLTAGERCFYRCGSLRQICLEDAEEIGREAFAGCTALEKGRVRAGVRIGDRAFEDTDFPDRIVSENGEAEFLVAGDVLVSGKNCRGELCLPEGIAGIASFAFSGNAGITGVKLPGSLRWTGEGAFFGCAGLVHIRFPEGLRRLGARTFEKCSSLSEAEFPENTKTLQIGARAFAGCVSLKRAVLPGVSILGERLFAGCTGLEECICETARAVQPYCFSGCEKLEKISFRNLFVVRAHAFEGCDSLKQAEFRDGLCLREHALEDCGRLETLILSGERGEIRLLEYALSGCTSLRCVVYRGTEWRMNSYRDLFSDRMPEAVKLLFHSAFSCFETEQEETLCSYRGCGRIVKIPSGIRRIKAEVFRNLPQLREVELPESVEYIGARAFHGTAWLEDLCRNSPMAAVNGMLLDGSRCRGEVTVPPDIRLVCGWAFANGLGIEKIRFVSERVKVEEYAFRNCISLKEIALPGGCCVRFSGIGDREKELPVLAKQAVTESLNCFKTDGNGVLRACTGNIPVLRLAHGITAVGDGAFQEGNLLTEIWFPDTVRRIGKSAFMGCKWLREVRQAQNVEEIGALAFSGCGSLERVELSERLHQIGGRAFENCTSLKEIRIPEGVEEIPERAFFRCFSLKVLVLPSTVRKIGREAFGFCRGLEEIRIPEGAILEERAFAGVETKAVPGR